jgi:hypothetical protein
VAFHVEIRQGHRWAREFNLDGERLRREVLDPWAADRTLRLGDRDWEPAECSLTILEGPELSGPELAFGRGWDRARRSGRAVTRELVVAAARDAGAVAVLAETDAGRDIVTSALAELGVEAIDWPAREGTAALVLAVESSDPPRGWLYEAGAAVGAAGGRAVVVRLTEAPAPSELGGLATAGPGRELAPALAEALRKLRPA